MTKIHQLPEEIVAKIAAGEVIERPVYAVKELVENAVDAGANNISIQIEQSGLKKIVVIDNGEGMSKDDVMASFKPHTTSKLTEDSLTGIATLGFRGEALASIAAISTLTIQSRLSSQSAGFQAHIETGHLKESTPVGMPVGTMVTVANLFHSIPARKKFLKTERTEFRLILGLITQYALAYPAIRFLLIHNKRTILDLPKSQTLSERVTKLLGDSIASQLIPIQENNQYLQLHGFIGRPQVATKGQSKQYLFVNQREVSDKLISSAVKDAFGNLLESTQVPFYILFLDIPFEMVDVNVHPRKETINFINPTMIYDFVKETITQTLTKNNLTFSRLNFTYTSLRAGTTNSYAAQVLRETTPSWNLKEVAQILKDSDILQLHNLYLLTQTKHGLILIDQHAAHERILYEEFKQSLEKYQVSQKSHKLKTPIIIDLPFMEMERTIEYLDSLKNLGFEIEEFSENSYRIDSVPELFQDRDIRPLILELLEGLAAERSSSALDKISELMLSFLACRSAIMAGEQLTQPEARKLIEKLEMTPNNATCPHGRPTKIEVTTDELEKAFKRT